MWKFTGPQVNFEGQFNVFFIQITNSVFLQGLTNYFSWMLSKMKFSYLS